MESTEIRQYLLAIIQRLDKLIELSIEEETIEKEEQQIIEEPKQDVRDDSMHYGWKPGYKLIHQTSNENGVIINNKFEMPDGDILSVNIPQKIEDAPKTKRRVRHS